MRGIAFKRLRDLDPSQPLRQVEVALPPGSEEFLRTFLETSNLNGQVKCLSIRTQKDALRFGNLALNEVL